LRAIHATDCSRTTPEKSFVSYWLVQRRPLSESTYIDEEHEDFICDLQSTNLERKYVGMPREAAYAVKFADLVSARFREMI
jgi:hypothetical protein